MLGGSGNKIGASEELVPGKVTVVSVFGFQVFMASSGECTTILGCYHNS